MDLFVTYGTTESVPQGLEWKDHAVLVGKIEKVKRFAVVIEIGSEKGKKNSCQAGSRQCHVAADISNSDSHSNTYSIYSIES
jgi:hypothetical protein